MKIFTKILIITLLSGAILPDTNAADIDGNDQSEEQGNNEFNADVQELHRQLSNMSPEELSEFMNQVLPEGQEENADQEAIPQQED